MTLDQMLAVFEWDFETAEIETQKVGDGLYVLFGLGGNIAVSIGADGVLIVDDQFPEMIPKVNAAIEALGGGSVDYAVNTHWHFDHAEGNLALGPAGTKIVAHSNARADMAQGGIINLVAMQYDQQAYPADALPTITFDDRMQFHYNGEQMDLVHAGPAHTTGDTAVIFRNHKAVHFGDVFNNTGYPFIDADSGGEINGMIAFCQAILDELPKDAIVIPGHGEITGLRDPRGVHRDADDGARPRGRRDCGRQDPRGGGSRQSDRGLRGGVRRCGRLPRLREPGLYQPCEVIVLLRRYDPSRRCTSSIQRRCPSGSRIIDEK